MAVRVEYDEFYTPPAFDQSFTLRITERDGDDVRMLAVEIPVHELRDVQDMRDVVRIIERRFPQPPQAGRLSI